jgi:hypothetical protein
MNSRRFIDRIALVPRQPVAELQDIELAANSQRVAERLCNLVAVVEAFDVRFGSIAADALEAMRACLSAFARKRTSRPTSWDVRFVPKAAVSICSNLRM